MKIAFLLNCSPEREEEIKKAMCPLGYSTISSTNGEEIRQTGKQLQKVVLCFADAGYAYKFLNTEKFSDFETLHLLFVPGRPKLTEEVAQKLRDVRLKIISPSDAPQFRELVANFEKVKNEETELEFLVHAKPGKNNAA